MFLWLSSFGFVETRFFFLFLACSFPNCIETFHLLSFVVLDLWKECVDLVLAWNILVSPYVLRVLLGIVAWASICVLLGSVCHLPRIFWLL